MKSKEFIRESAEGQFSKALIHETTDANAENIRVNGFKIPRRGIFFNLNGQNYSGGGYGGAKITARVSGPLSGMLDLDGDIPEGLSEFSEGEEIAEFCHANNYWAWMDDLQLAVLKKGTSHCWASKEERIT